MWREILVFRIFELHQQIPFRLLDTVYPCHIIILEDGL